ncbi:MAG: hypothetical protein V4578_16805 [Pseudomonadota bacterium]
MNDKLMNLLAARHRPAPLTLPDDAREATAFALAAIRGDDTFDRATAIEGLSLRIDKLVDASGDDALSELAAHLPILEALFLRFATDAIETNLPANKSALARMALSAQASFGRTLALMAGLKLQRAGRAEVTVHDDGGNS